MQESWHSYPSIYALGHAALKELFADPVVVQEKVDGSQFSFGLFHDGYRARSKNQQLTLPNPSNMFTRACDVIQALPLQEGWTYRAEYLSKPKHNTLAYARVPKNHLIIFDINTGHEEYLSQAAMEDEAARLGLECVPCFVQGMIEDLTQFKALLNNTSVLGDQKIEGVVVKNYAKFGPDKKALMGKYVSEAFKEIHAREWRRNNPTSGDIIQELIKQHRTPARWQKAVQHIKERGELQQSPADIGPLFKEVHLDIRKECEDDIKQVLYDYAMPKILKGVCAGLPDWYKEELLKQQFGGGSHERN